MHAKILERASSQIGVAFRPRGRTPDVALDCVGFAIYALFGLRGLNILLNDYSLRGEYATRIFDGADDFELTQMPMESEIAPGDLIIQKVAAGQYHFLIKIEGAFAHAHAAIGRIVASPTLMSGKIIGHWRVSSQWSGV